MAPVTNTPHPTPAYSEGICGEGAAILRDGVPMSISEILELLTEVGRLRAVLQSVGLVERQIRFVAYTSAGDPRRMEDMKMFAVWAGSLQAALAKAEAVP